MVVVVVGGGGGGSTSTQKVTARKPENVGERWWGRGYTVYCCGPQRTVRKHDTAV